MKINFDGGEIIYKNKQLILMISLLFIAILSLNAISASQVDSFSFETADSYNDCLSTVDNSDILEDIEIDDSNQNDQDPENSNQDTNDIETGEGINGADDGGATSGESSTNQETITNDNIISPDKTKIIVMNTSVVKERKLVLKLVDSNNKPIANKKISITLAKKTYSNITDKNGKISLKISLEPGKYTVKVKFLGDENYEKSNKTFIMNVFKLKTNFTVPKTSIIRGQYFYAYLKDKNNNPLASKSVSIKYMGKTYYKTTDKNGRFKLKINAKIGKYDAKLIYKGSKSYLKTSKNIRIKSYNATTKITFNANKVVRSKYLHIYLKYGSNKSLANRKIVITFKNKKHIRTTNKNGMVYFKISEPVGSYKIKVQFNGGKGFKKSSKSTKIKILPNYTAIFIAKNKTSHRNENKTVKYYIKLTDLKGNPIAGETVVVKVKCNNFTSGSGIKITKKTIVLSSDNIETKTADRKRMNDMAKLLRAKGYKVIVSGIGPNYHVNSVRDYKNVCVFHLVGGIDSGMFVDMSHGYYQNYLKKNNNQFVLGCPKPPNNVNLANRTWLIRAHDDDYSPKSFKGLYFPGKYLNKKTRVNYVYGDNPEELVNNFMKYAKKGKSYGMDDTIPGAYTTYKLTTTKNGYVRLDLPIGNHTVVCSFTNKNKGYTTDKLTTWVNVIK